MPLRTRSCSEFRTAGRWTDCRSAAEAFRPACRCSSRSSPNRLRRPRCSPSLCSRTSGLRSADQASRPHCRSAPPKTQLAVLSRAVDSAARRLVRERSLHCSARRTAIPERLESAPRRLAVAACRTLKRTAKRPRSPCSVLAPGRRRTRGRSGPRACSCRTLDRRASRFPPTRRSYVIDRLLGKRPELPFQAVEGTGAAPPGRQKAGP